MIGDLLKIALSRDPTNHHGGYVHKVRDLGVLVHLSRDFPFFSGADYDVEFTLNRLPLRRQHQAVCSVNTPTGRIARRILFPDLSRHAGILARRAVAEDDWSPINRQMVDNGPQKDAVRRILEMEEGSPPFIVFGPYVLPQVLP